MTKKISELAKAQVKKYKVLVRKKEKQLGHGWSGVIIAAGVTLKKAWMIGF